MPRMTAGKRSELESFWRAHLDGWRRGDLNQREYLDLQSEVGVGTMVTVYFPAERIVPSLNQAPFCPKNSDDGQSTPSRSINRGKIPSAFLSVK